MYLNTFETIHFHFLQIPCFQTLNSPLSIGTGNMSESYVEAKTVLSMRKKLLSNFTVFWNNRRLIGSCLYLLVLARGLFLRRLSPLVVIWFTRVLLSIFGHKSPEFAILKEQPSEKGCRTYTDDVIISIQILFTVHFPFHIWREGKQTNNTIPKMEFCFPKVHLIIVGQNGPWDVILICINY